MKSLIIILFFLVFQVNAQFKLGTNPQNPSRTPDPRTEMGVILEKNSPTITIGGANNKKYKNYLSAGILVIADKKTGFASWVGVCGNDILTTWKPSGKIVYFHSEESYKFECEDMLKRLEGKLDNIQEGVDKLLLERHSLYELKEATTIISPAHNWTWTPLIVLGGAGIGALVGGYGFRTTVTTTDVTVVPGLKLQTGDGTIIFGPNKTIINKSSHKKFNVGAAIGCGIASGLITYLLMEIF